MRVDGEKYFAAMVEFAQECVRSGFEVVMTIVDIESVDRARAQQLVEHKIGATFKIRPLF